MNGWRRFIRRDMRRNPKHIRRVMFMRDAFVESRVKCSCELCALAHGRLLYPRCGGEALRLRRIPGFTTNFPLTKRNR